MALTWNRRHDAPQPSLANEVANLHATLQALESRVASGEVPREGLAEFKSSVDDLRLRLWGLMRRCLLACPEAARFDLAGGTHALGIAARAHRPVLIYRDAGGRLLEKPAMEPLTLEARTP